MAFAAVPNYLGRDFSAAAPGHRFYLYFQVWGFDHRNGVPCWGTADQGNDGKTYQNKAGAVDKTLPLTENDKRAMAALAERQRAIAGDHVWWLPAQTVAPLTTGLGMEHPLENGFAFLHPYGLPYLAGSGIKGVLRQAARELRDDEPESGWTNEIIDALFGADTGDTAARGALIFWDVFPELKDSLITEVMTPHQTHYYQDQEPPHDSGKPNPIPFLAIPPGCSLTFYVDCNRHLLPDALREDEAWQGPLRAAFEHAFEWLGFGAKTAVGYGHVALDTDALEREAEKQREQQARQAEQQRIKASTQGLPEDAAWLEAQRQRGAWPDNAAFLHDMEQWLDNLQADALTAAAWQRIEAEMAQRYGQSILIDPDATQGKKQKPRYKERPRAIAKRLIALKPDTGSS